MSLHDLVPRGSVGAIYGRFSTVRQERTMQIGTIESMLTKYGWDAPHVYFDEGVSATKNKMDDRKELKRMLADAKQRKFSFVITYGEDRLARNATEHRRIRETMAKQGIPIILCNPETVYDNGDVIGQLVQDGYTQFEAEQTRVRTRDTLHVNIKKGNWFGGTLPYGYRLDKNTNQYTVIPSEKPIIVGIFDSYLLGMSFDDIANSMPFKTIEGRDWTKERIRTIITNPFYAGTVRAFKANPKSPNSILPKEKWTMGESNQIEPVISMVKWEQCWALFEKKRQGEIKPRNFKTPYLLKGLLYCQHDEEHEYMMTTKNYVNQSSSGTKYSGRKYICPACHRNVDAEAIEKRVRDEVYSLIARKSDDIEIEMERRLQDEVHKSQKEIRNLVREIEEQKTLHDRAGNEMKTLGTWGNKEEAHKVRYALQQFRLSTQEQITDKNQRIETYKRRIEYIEKTETKAGTWKKLSAQVGDPAADRRLFLYLLEQVTIDFDGQIDVVARV